MALPVTCELLQRLLEHSFGPESWAVAVVQYAQRELHDLREVLLARENATSKTIFSLSLKLFVTV